MTRPRESVLVLFPGALGDFLCFLPALCGLRARHRGTLTLVAKPTLLELIELPDIGTASIDGREVADLFASDTDVAPATATRFGHFDFAYSWTGFASDGFANRLRHVAGGTTHVFAFRATQPGEHAVDYYARCIGVPATLPAPAPIHYDGGWLAPFRRRHDLVNRPFVVMHPGSGSAKKNWLGFAALAQRWLDCRDDAVLWLQGPSENHLDLPRGVIPVDGLTLPQVAAALRVTALYLGNDSGISHLAGVVGAPGVVLFGATDAATWAPRSARLRVLQGRADCSQCAPNVFCTHRLPVDVVWQALATQPANPPHSTEA